MELNIEKDKIAALGSHVSKSLETLTTLERTFVEVKGEIEKLELEYFQLGRKIGWREKYLMGFLWGDRELAKVANQKKNELENAKDKLSKITSNKDHESQHLNKEMGQFLLKNSVVFGELQDEIGHQSRLLKSSKSYELLLGKAKQGMIDALLWTNWETLINHKDAKRELGNFRKETEKFQKHIDAHTSKARYKLDELVELDGLIKFSSKKVAMNSFGQLMKQTLKHKNHASKSLRETRQLKDEMISSTRTKVFTLKRDSIDGEI